MANYVFGIDVGGTSVKCGLFQTDGTLLEKWEIPTRHRKRRKRNSAGYRKKRKSKNG